MRRVLGVAVLPFQIGAIIYARFVPARYFCRAPYDGQHDYVIEVADGGRTLSEDEIRRRYKKRARGTGNRSIQHVKDIISGYETSYGIGEDAQVTLSFRVNGGEEQSWKWPRR